MTLLNDLRRTLDALPIKEDAREELMSLLSRAIQDEDDGIRDASKLVALALREKARGWLEQEDIVILLQGQRDIAQIRANNAQIALSHRIQALVIRVIDISLVSVLKVL